MRIPLKGTTTNAVFNPLRAAGAIGRHDGPGEKVGLGLLTPVDFVLETPFALLENLFWRLPARVAGKQHLLRQYVTLCQLDLPDELETENTLMKVEPGSSLRQRFVDQYSDRYSLHRIDFRVCPILEEPFRDFRVMDLELTVEIDGVRSTDVFPQTRWEKEGLRVGDKVYVNAIGKFESKLRPLVIGGPTGRTDTEVGHNYFYELNYSTEVPTVEGRALNNGFGWRLRGTYERYIPCATHLLTAMLIVPKAMTHTTARVTCSVGITDSDRRQPVYPADASLRIGSATVERVNITFASSGGRT